MKKYKQLENFQTNFGSEYHFNFDGEASLYIEDNDSFIKDFFNIKSDFKHSINASAIVGENGSGKSTILDFISEYMRDVTPVHDYILIYSMDNNLYIDHRYDKKFDKIDHTNKGVKLVTQNFDSKTHVSLFFSNVFDARYIGMGKESDEFNYKNISTNTLLGRKNNIESFLNEEFEKQIFFIHEHQEDLKVSQFMTIPPKIYLELFKDFAKQILVPSKLQENLFSIFEDGDEDVGIIHFNNDSKDPFISDFNVYFLECYFLHLNDLLREYTVESEKVIIESFNNRKSINIYEEIFNSIKMELKNSTSFSNRHLNKVMHEIKVLNSSFKKLYLFFNKIELKREGNRIYIETNSPNTKKFISLYKEAIKKVDILKFSWSEMSSGEYGLLSLFGRFHAALKEVKEEAVTIDKFNIDYRDVEGDKTSNRKSFLLLIDEGDLYFHPQWQKDWLFYFLELVTILFEGDVQIILTTHSPFVLSDFPNTNVTFLKGLNKTVVIENDLDGSPRTFGANISELFSNSFFIDDGLLGKFAKVKINSFIKQIFQKTPMEIYRDKDYIEKFIDLIGEPLVKNKMMQVYREKLELYSGNEIESRIMVLENELMKLKNLREHND
ncbi:AAA family ATPase [Sporosarcina ureae]|uniref:AAA family ATPase n=1 Tax=Sporosarcina ureae TaxID=1571 RepID=UPI0028AAF92B|nr:AAA family ATPase [Sporosarcina ureae]